VYLIFSGIERSEHFQGAGKNRHGGIGFHIGGRILRGINASYYSVYTYLMKFGMPPNRRNCQAS